MSGDLRPVTYHYKLSHAEKLRRVAGKLAKLGDTECIEVALWMHNTADKIENEFSRSNVVKFAPRQPEPPNSAA